MCECGAEEEHTRDRQLALESRKRDACGYHAFPYFSRFLVRSFSARNKLEKAVAAIAVRSADSAKLKNLSSIFSALDVDQDGVLSLDEVEGCGTACRADLGTGWEGLRPWLNYETLRRLVAQLRAGLVVVSEVTKGLAKAEVDLDPALERNLSSLVNEYGEVRAERNAVLVLVCLQEPSRT